MLFGHKASLMGRIYFSGLNFSGRYGSISSTVAIKKTYEVIKATIDVERKRRERMKKGLLDHMAEQMGRFCLSDLRSVEHQCLCTCLEELPAEAYSLWEWTDAVQYLTGNNKSFSSRSEARDFLIHALDTAAK